MKILFSPQIREKKIKYTFKNDVIEVEMNGKKDAFDFSSFGEGTLKLFDEEGKSLIETTLDEQPIRKAERKTDGVLYVELINFIDIDSTEEERFPEWKDHTEIEGGAE